MRRLEELLARRAAFGVKLGLERIVALLELLDQPQRRFRAIHVVGTNGKSSTARFCAAILGAHGLRAGAYLSPHVSGFAERVQLDGVALDEAALSVAVERVEIEAAAVDAASDAPLTQFEVLTAAAFSALAEAGAEVVAVEAGLGGRFDATNVLAAPVVLLTNVALDHVDQLGATRAAIGAEKLAVVAPGATLVVGEADGELRGLVAMLAGQAGRVIELEPGADVPGAPPLAAAGRFQRANLALALAGCEAFLGAAFDERRAIAAAAATAMPGRLQIVDERPLTVLDGAHNPHGARALVAALPAVVGERRPRLAVIAMLADKDVAGVLEVLVPAFDAAVATATSSPRALPAAALAARVRDAGLADCSIAVSPAAAVAVARACAGPTGAVVVCGSLSLLADVAATSAFAGAV